MLKISSSLIILLFLLSCGDTKSGREKITSPRVKKETKIVSPKQNSRLTRGTSVNVEIGSSEGITIDSVSVSFGSEPKTLDLGD